MSVRHVNAPRYNWKKIRQYIFWYLPLYMWTIQWACWVCEYRDIMILERETITEELLLTKLTHQPLLSLAVWKRALSCKIQWNWMFEKARHDCWFFCPGCIHNVNMNQLIFCFSITYIRVRLLWKIAISSRTDTIKVGVF